MSSLFAPPPTLLPSPSLPLPPSPSLKQEKVKKKAQEEAREIEYARHKFSKLLPIEAFNSQ